MTLRAEGRKFETCTAHSILAMTVADTEILIDFLAGAGASCLAIAAASRGYLNVRTAEAIAPAESAITIQNM